MPPVPLAWATPFAALLLAIAVLPLAAGHWWERNRNKALVAAACALPVAVWTSGSMPGELRHALLEYAGFMALLGSLFTISGGLFVDCDLRATPKVNAAFLAAGALLANVVGTTGASMLLIRPLLRTNSERKHVVHTVVFFIFVVCNTGGCLSPLGDPPLFVGYLRGVPFEWTLRLWPAWLLVNASLVFAYVVWDGSMVLRETHKALREDRRRFEPLRGWEETPRGAGVDAAQPMKRRLVVPWRPAAAVLALGNSPELPSRERLASGSPGPNRRSRGVSSQPLSVRGKGNFVLLAGVVAAVLWLPAWWREGAMVVLALTSFRATPGEVHSKNGFGWGPIVEVAVIFAGIFVTMVPALAWLNRNAAHLGVTTPAQFFWATGALSSFLDNTPTYAAFLEVARGLGGPSEVAGTSHATLEAIALGAVFMGANTYVGNGPNFMVRAIAEAQGLKMPSFFGYMLWSLGILIPLFVVTSLLLFQ